MKKNCYWINYKWIIIQNYTSHIRDKVRVVLDLSNYSTKKKLEHAAGFQTSDLAAKKILLL